MDISEEDSVGELLMYIDNTIQYGEDLDVKVPRVSSLLHWDKIDGFVCQQ